MILGQALKKYLGRVWTRQAVSDMQSGRRAFVAGDLLGLAGALKTPVEDLLLPAHGTPEDEVIVSLPARKLTIGDLYDLVIGVTEADNDEMVARAGSERLKRRLAEFRRVHNLSARVTAHMGELLEEFEELAHDGWYLTRGGTE